jgi:hypothetical protein
MVIIHSLMKVLFNLKHKTMKQKMKTINIRGINWYNLLDHIPIAIQDMYNIYRQANQIYFVQGHGNIYSIPLDSLSHLDIADDSIIFRGEFGHLVLTENNYAICQMYKRI